jgi:phosphatidate cytidylyltransferase
MEDDIPLEEPPKDAGPAPQTEIVKRLVSGVGFAAIAIALAWAGLVPFALLVLIVAVVISWEWARVVRGTDFDLTFVIHAAAVAAATILSGLGFAALGLAALLVGAIIVVPVEFGRRPVYSSLGVLYAGLPAIAILWLRGTDSAGFSAVLFLLLVVWATDTAAFVAGRLIGGPKLAPMVSPNKTWAGFGGAMVASALTAVVFALVRGAPPASLALTALAISVIAQGGDLAESALKRAFGVKDASALIPGHGGFMDRMDGIVAVAVAAGLFALFVNAHAPAEALLSRP